MCKDTLKEKSISKVINDFYFDIIQVLYAFCVVWVLYMNDLWYVS